MAPKNVDVAVIGAGAAGMMAAATAGQYGKSVWLGDHRPNPGEKIRISGGGRCNFTNIHSRAENFLSANPHFVKSALAQYTARDFIDMVERHGIAYHEKKLGQLFCDHSARDIITMLVDNCRDAGVELALNTSIDGVSHDGGRYRLTTSSGVIDARALIVACGGLSIPKIGATGFGYDLARQFGHEIIPTRAALVPLTFDDDLLDQCRDLAGVSVDARVNSTAMGFQEGLLFTHRGLSGPSVLQISSYWQDGEDIAVDLAPDTDARDALITMKRQHPKQDCATALSKLLPKRLAQSVMAGSGITTPLGETPDRAIEALANTVNNWQVTPAGSEGYLTAEVTLGGVDTHGLNSKTMESRHHPGLFFIGEVVDVTGHLGGYNFQWAWSSGFVAGQNA
ncbi:MAG: NAD(P)/FAD-dependent oxidoreductase [Alphaproteobacteria bacterium]|nr:NAD(P)/FAD-dependent oxidoreductase [Alphaproteobacteria bacterium]